MNTINILNCIFCGISAIGTIVCAIIAKKQLPKINKSIDNMIKIKGGRIKTIREIPTKDGIIKDGITVYIDENDNEFIPIKGEKYFIMGANEIRMFDGKSMVKINE